MMLKSNPASTRNCHECSTAHRGPGFERPLSDEEAKIVACHESGHAVASIVAFRSLGWKWRAFDRILVRRDARHPFTDRSGTSRFCIGIVDGAAIYAPTGHDRPIWPRGLQAMLAARMEWQITSSLAGGFAEMNFRGMVDGHDQKTIRSYMRCSILPKIGSLTDHMDALAVIRDLRTETGCSIPMRRLERRTQVLVRSNWYAISALAEVLAEESALSFERTVEIAAPLLKYRRPVGWQKAFSRPCETSLLRSSAVTLPIPHNIKARLLPHPVAC